jgi:phospholipid/cholesterol/gamma-HCH transport system substrate-binding protein
MKFSIRHAEKIVGAFVILALAVLVLVVIMLGRSQRWFSRDYQYKCYFRSGDGLSQNMPVLFKGFTIGYVKTVELTDDDSVEVIFTVFDTYNDRVMEGSIVDISVSPIGLGSQFLFYPGRGENQHKEGDIIPILNSIESRRLTAMGYTDIPTYSDGINSIVNQVNILLHELNEAFIGTARTSVGRTLGNVEMITSDLAGLFHTITDDVGIILNDITARVDPILAGIEPILSSIDPILSDIGGITSKLSDSSGTVMSILDGEGPIYNDLVSILDSIAALLRNVEKVGDFLPSQLPQISILLADLHGALSAAEDVLIALTNNPLLRGGVPTYNESYPGAANPRDLEF